MVVSAALSDQLPPQLRRVGVILCGGNVDLDNLPWLRTASPLPRELNNGASAAGSEQKTGGALSIGIANGHCGSAGSAATDELE